MYNINTKENCISNTERLGSGGNSSGYQRCCQGSVCGCWKRCRGSWGVMERLGAHCGTPKTLSFSEEEKRKRKRSWGQDHTSTWGTAAASIHQGDYEVRFMNFAVERKKKKKKEEKKKRKILKRERNIHALQFFLCAHGGFYGLEFTPSSPETEHREGWG